MLPIFTLIPCEKSKTYTTWIIAAKRREDIGIELFLTILDGGKGDVMFRTLDHRRL